MAFDTKIAVNLLIVVHAIDSDPKGTRFYTFDWGL